jgi:hypothetical protein
MAKNNKSSILLYLCLFITGVMVIPVLASCGKTGVSPSSGLNARLQIVNLSPDIQPFNLYAATIKQSTNAYAYPSASGYFLINTIDLPFQIRTAQLVNGENPTNLLTLTDTLKPNMPYTWFVTGLLKGNSKDSSLASILTVDTGSVPGIGRAKIRFVNTSPGTTKLSLTANNTEAFKNIPYKGITNFVEVTAGSYDLNITATNTPSIKLASLPNYTVLDGKLYTVYFYGLPNTADTARYAAAILLNSLPPDTKY